MTEFTLDKNDNQLTDKPVHEAVKTIAEYGDQNIAISVVDARKELDDDSREGKTILWPMAFDARLDRFEEQRLEVIADVLEARVIGVEVPGIGSKGAKTTWQQKKAIAKGDFSQHAHAMLGALAELIPFEEDEELEMILFSQGASEGVAMVRELGSDEGAHGLNLKIPRITIIEPVNDQPWKLFGKNGLLAKIGQDTSQENVDRYLQENQNYPWLAEPSGRNKATNNEWKKLNRRQVINRMLPGAALRKSFLPVLLEALGRDAINGKTGINQAAINLLRMNGSEVARQDQNRQSLEQLIERSLGRAGLINLVPPPGEAPHRHPAVHSMPNVDVIARELLQ